MSSGSTIVSTLLSIASIINSYIIVDYSYRYGWKKKRGDVVRAIFAKAEKPFKKTSERLEIIRGEVRLVKFFIYGGIFLFFLLIPHLEKGNVYHNYGVSLVLYGNVTFYLFFILFLIENVLQLTNLEAKIQSYWLYVLIKSLYPTILDLLFILEFYLFLGLSVYSISSPPSPPLSTYYLLQILYSIATIFVGFLLILIVLFAFFRPITEHIKLFVDLESVIFKDVRDSIEIRVWTGGSVYEGKVRGIGENLVIYSIDSQPRDHIIRIRWDSIQAFEVIVPKQEQTSMVKSYFM